MITEYRVLYEAPLGTPRQTEALTREDAITFCRSITLGKRHIVQMTPSVVATYQDGQTSPTYPPEQL